MNKKETLAVLDKVLSPFEDMTEYAVEKIKIKLKIFLYKVLFFIF